MAKGRASEPLLVLAGLVLALADATKYPTALWDPVVIALAVLLAAEGGAHHQDWRLEGNPAALAAFRRGVRLMR